MHLEHLRNSIIPRSDRLTKIKVIYATFKFLGYGVWNECVTQHLYSYKGQKSQLPLRLWTRPRKPVRSNGSKFPHIKWRSWGVSTPLSNLLCPGFRDPERRSARLRYFTISPLLQRNTEITCSSRPRRADVTFHLRGFTDVILQIQNLLTQTSLR